MTTRQNIYLSLKAYLEMNGYAPTQKEIGEAVGKSESCVGKHLRMLARMNFIVREARRWRGIRLVA